ncbi:ABC transporter permease [Virgibacillus profundi]|uniref:ABC transporter permease n=1 Tax=Virgibacillus profundi TaxID=2024555 RepID=A0A2A2IBB1_9BACI|nr:ABC transporter permease [Virgibacillus profundi]PAV29291.1 ABC transporter permease [Virgibacillus profundi]PXY53460.1 ABC transporter permease [Virgibacillus profundi]
MFNSHEFFKKRFSAHLKETGRYLKYIFNGHTAIAMLFFISALAYYYQQWLIEIPENFPTSFIIGAGFGLLVSYSPIRTLLKEPDLVFLIAAENKMSAYFRNALIYSFVIQLYLILLVSAAFGPLYFATFPDRAGNVYLLTIAVVFIFKIWNLVTNWWMLKVREPGVRRVDLGVRTLLNMAVFYFLINGDMVYAGITTALFIIIFLYDYNVSRKQAGIVWDVLVEKDRNRMQTFYRIANMFADVPHLKNPIKKRGWLVSLVSKLPFTRKHTFDYLYRITFVRSGDYLGMYVRLIIIGGLAIYFIPNLWMKIIFAILFLYLSCFQMMTLYQHHRTIMWLDLYPVESSIRQKAVVKLLFQLTFLQAVLFSLLFLVMQAYLGFVIALAAGIAFNYLFINGYVKRKLV